MMMMMMTWILAPCRLVGRCQRFGEIYCPHLQGWRWQYVSTKRWHIPLSQHGAKTQNNISLPRSLSSSLSNLFMNLARWKLTVILCIMSLSTMALYLTNRNSVCYVTYSRLQCNETIGHGRSKTTKTETAQRTLLVETESRLISYVLRTLFIHMQIKCSEEYNVRRMSYRTGTFLTYLSPTWKVEIFLTTLTVSKLTCTATFICYLSDWEIGVWRYNKFGASSHGVSTVASWVGVVREGEDGGTLGIDLLLCRWCSSFSMDASICSTS
jgi:hypothetical protein